MKNLFILLAFLFVTFSSYAVAPYGIKGQQQSTTLYSNVHQFPNNQVTNLGGINALVETGNKNILDNAGFEHSTFSTSWTNSAGTFTQETSTVIDGKASAKLVLSSQTMSLTQSSTLYASAFADGVQGLVSVRIKSNVALKVCAIQAGTVSTVDCVDVTNDNKWSFYKIPFILGATSNGISIASSGAVSGTVYIDDAFVGQANVTDIAPIITDWVDFPSVAAGTLITGTTTSPAYGTVVNNKAQWRRVGPNMEIRWDYRQSTISATVGSGNYLFNLPAGYQMDTSKVIVNSSIGATAGAGNDSASLGTLKGTYGITGNVSAHLMAYSATQLKAYGFISTGSSIATGFWGSTGTLDFTLNATQAYNLTAVVPILGWGSNSSMYSAPCGANCVDVFSAQVTDGAATTTVSQENSDFINGNCTNPSAGNFTCSFNSGTFIDPPNCTITEYGVNGGGTPLCKILTGSSLNTSVSIFCETPGGTDTDRSFNLLCQKQGADFTAARTIVGSFKQITDMPQTKAYVSFDGSTLALLSGTYSRTLTTVTVTATAHGHKVGHKVYLDFTSGTAVDGLFDVVSVPDANTFTVTHATSGSTTGNVNLNRITLITSRNIHSAYRQATGVYWVNFTDFMSNTNYVVSGNTWVSAVPRDMAGLPSAEGYFYVETSTSGVGNTQGNPVTAIVTQ